MSDFKLHVHRLALHDESKPKKWYVHVDAWGPEPYAFVDCVVRVPMRTVIDLKRGDRPDHPEQSCAQAWLEGQVDDDAISYSEDGMVLFLGKA